MAPPLPPEEGVFFSWPFLEWAWGGTWAAILLVSGLLWREGRRRGDSDRRFSVLEARVEANHMAVERRADKFDGRLDSLDQSNRVIEKAVYGLPDRMDELRVEIQNIHRRLDEVLRRPH
jgi:hypothetical protein